MIKNSFSKAIKVIISVKEAQTVNPKIKIYLKINKISYIIIKIIICNNLDKNYIKKNL